MEQTFSITMTYTELPSSLLELVKESGEGSMSYV